MNTDSIQMVADRWNSGTRLFPGRRALALTLAVSLI